MPPSERDRQYMQRIGRYKAESHEQASQEHRALPLEERLLRSWLLFMAGRDSASLDPRDDDPARSYAIARAKGLCGE
jgi:hypothetical protein